MGEAIRRPAEFARTPTDGELEEQRHQHHGYGDDRGDDEEGRECQPAGLGAVFAEVDVDRERGQSGLAKAHLLHESRISGKADVAARGKRIQAPTTLADQFDARQVGWRARNSSRASRGFRQTGSAGAVAAGCRQRSPGAAAIRVPRSGRPSPAAWAGSAARKRPVSPPRCSAGSRKSSLRSVKVATHLCRSRRRRDDRLSHPISRRTCRASACSSARTRPCWPMSAGSWESC
jgi:hypothetical protein